jgi:gamma-D-glutamyl-L-lysine dipeptidyl-peptidase
MTNILDDYAKTIDPRTSLFDVKIEAENNGTLILSGRVLDKSQLDELPRLFPNRKLDIASIRILSRNDLPRMNVATNLTGLYEKPTFGMPLSSELCFGTELEILDEQGRWVFIRQKDGYLGWAYKPYLIDEVTIKPTHLVLVPSCELRAEPNAGSEIITRVVSGTRVFVVETNGEWAKAIANRTGWMPSSLLRALDELPRTIEEKCKMLIEDSERMIGVPYLWGGTSGNGIDCSGFARLLHQWIGIDIPRDADMQCDAAKPVEPPFDVGDLLFFGEDGSERKVTHVGISLGGWRMIHSSRGRNGVYIDNVQEKESLREIYMSAGSFLR